jgi:hypothetical protein
MSASDLVLHVEGLGKQYRIGQPRGSRTLREAVTETLGGLARRLPGGAGAGTVA